MWVALSPGLAVLLSEGRCSTKLTKPLDTICSQYLSLYGTPLLTNIVNAFMFVGVCLFVALRYLEARRIWQKTGEISWFTEVALLVISGYLGFLSWFLVAISTTSDAL
jgi:hypothetical protein